MTEYTNGIIPLERGEAAIIAGVGGSGKTGLLEAIYQSEVDRKKRNVVMMHSPSRLFEASPSLAIIDFEYSDLYGEEKEAFKRIEKERGEKSLSSEFSAILRLILESLDCFPQVPFLLSTHWSMAWMERYLQKL